MDVNCSKVALVAYLVIALLGIGGLVAYVGHVQQGFSERIAQVEGEMNGDQSFRRPPVLLERRDVPQAVAASAEMEKVLELRKLLDERTRLLEQRSNELARTTDEYKKLGVENDRYLAMLTDLMKVNEPTAAVEVETSTPVQDPTIDEDLDLLEWALSEAQGTINMLEAAQLQQRELTAAVETAIVDSGPAAIPVLLSMLMNDRADLRIWSATLLGRLGPLAAESSDALRIIATEDQDPNARQTAAWAMSQIEANFD